jgi:hypothetical protein
MGDIPTRSKDLDSRAAWIVASAALAVLTIAFGAPLLSAVALKPIAADLHTARAAPQRRDRSPISVVRSAASWRDGCPAGSRSAGS